MLNRLLAIWSNSYQRGSLGEKPSERLLLKTSNATKLTMQEDVFSSSSSKQ